MGYIQPKTKVSYITNLMAFLADCYPEYTFEHEQLPLMTKRIEEMTILAKIKSMKLRRQLQTMLAILIVIPIIVLGLFMYSNSKKNLIDQVKATMESDSAGKSVGLDNNCQRISDVGKFFSYETEFREALEHGRDDEAKLTSALNETIEPLIWYYLSSDSNIEAIRIFSDLVPEEHLGEFLSLPLTDTEKNWYETCKMDYSAMWMADGEGGVYYIRPLLDAATSSKLIGVVAIKVNNEIFFSMIERSSYYNNGLIIVDRNGGIIMQKKVADTGMLDEITGKILSGEYQIKSGEFIENDNYFLTAGNRLQNEWDLYYYVARSEIRTDIISIVTTDVILAVILFGIAFFTASIYANSLSRRIESLNNAAGKIRNGDFDIVIEDKSGDEIGQLADSMADMAIQLEVMMDEINKRNEQDLLAKESDIHYREWLFDFVVEKNNDILVVLGEDSYAPSFITSNAEEILGIEQTELEGDIRKIARAQKESDNDDEERFDAIIEECLASGRPRIVDEIRFANLKTNELLYYRGVIVSTIDDGGKRTAIALYDRTQEFKRNHQLQEALTAAETANKAKTSFLANMSHDFRTPMNAITGFNLLIDKNSEEPEKVREYTHKISLASQNLLSLLNDVLDMSKIESGKTTLDIKEMAIGLLLEEINSVISFQAKAKNQEYIVRVEDMEHDMFMGDKQRINEILVNILGNAVKYTPEGGKIEFAIDESPSSSVGFQNVRFTIKDNGIGMKPEYKDKIFEAFSREDKGATKGIQGTGLGMAITKSLVELMGGTIRVESEEGKGSTFIVNLRLQVVDGEDVDFWRANGISRILIVDESREVYEQFNRLLTPDGIEVLEANSAYSALHVIDDCDNEQKVIDVIMIDEVVEGMAAPEIIKAIRGKDKRNNVLIFVMAEDFSRIEDDARAAGSNELLQKPVFVSTFKQTIGDIRNRTSKADKEEVKNPLEGMRFLAAEDNDINADILTELMSMEGATVERACNGQEAVEMFKAAKEGDYDMILMDIQMPVMTGYEAASAIRAIQTDWARKIPIIAMTANAYADDVQHAFDAGMNAHITKPIDIKIVEKTILEFKG